MNRPITGHIFGLKTKKGIAILQLAEEPPAPTALQLTRICNGFLQEPYTDEDISRVVCQKELFFMKTALRCIHPKSKLYREFFTFDRPFSLPEKLCLPQYLRGYSVQKDGSVKWYKKRRESRYRRFVSALTPDFLDLSPDSSWSLPDICEFLESGKSIRDYV